MNTIAVDASTLSVAPGYKTELHYSKADDPQDKQSQKSPLNLQPDGIPASDSRNANNPNTNANQKDKVDAREMPLLLARKARRRGKESRNHSKEARQVRFVVAAISLIPSGLCQSPSEYHADEERNERKVQQSSHAFGNGKEAYASV